MRPYFIEESRSELSFFFSGHVAVNQRKLQHNFYKQETLSCRFSTLCHPFHPAFLSSVFYPISTDHTKWSNTLKQFVGNLPTNCLSVFEQFVILALKGLNVSYNLFQLISTSQTWFLRHHHDEVLNHMNYLCKILVSAKRRTIWNLGNSRHLNLTIFLSSNNNTI